MIRQEPLRRIHGGGPVRFAPPQRNLNSIHPILGEIGGNPTRFSDELNGLRDSHHKKEKGSHLSRNTFQETKFHHTFPDFPTLPSSNTKVETVEKDALKLEHAGDEETESGVRRQLANQTGETSQTRSDTTQFLSAHNEATKKTEIKGKSDQTAEEMNHKPIELDTSHLETLVSLFGTVASQAADQSLKGGDLRGTLLKAHEKGNAADDLVKTAMTVVPEESPRLLGGQPPTEKTPQASHLSDNLKSGLGEAQELPQEKAEIKGESDQPTLSHTGRSEDAAGTAKSQTAGSSVSGKGVPDNPPQSHEKGRPIAETTKPEAQMTPEESSRLLKGGALLEGRHQANHLSNPSKFDMASAQKFLQEGDQMKTKSPESSGAHFGMGQDRDKGTGRDSPGFNSGGHVGYADFQHSVPSGAIDQSMPEQSARGAELIQRLTDEIRLNLYNGKNELEVKLQPEHLGELKIKISERGNVFTIEIKTERSDVKHLLEQGLSSLKQNLERTGVEVGNFNVSLENGEGSDNYNRLWREDRDFQPALGKSRRKSNTVRGTIVEEGIVNILV